MTTSDETGAQGLRPTVLRGRVCCILRSQPIEHDKRSQQVARLLAVAGAEVTIVCLGPEDRSYRSDDGYGVRQLSVGSASQHPVRVARILANIRREWAVSRSFVRLARSVPADVYHAMNVDTLLAAFRAAGRTPVVYDSREHWATTGDVPKRVRFWWVLKERLLIPRASAVVTVTDMIADALEKEHGIPRPTVLLNGSLGAVSESTPSHAPLRLIHQGKLYRDRHLPDLIDAVMRHGGRATLTIQGWGDAEDELRDLIDARGAGSVVSMVPPVPLESAVSAAAEHDVGLINIWPDSMSHQWAGPNKLFDYMGAGLAQIVTALDFMRRVVEAAQCGIIVDPPTVDSFADAIGWMIDNPNEVTRMKRNAVAAAPGYTWDGQADVLYGLYGRVLSDDPRSAARQRT